MTKTLSSLRLKLRTAALLSPKQLSQYLVKKLDAVNSLAKINRRLGIYLVRGVEKTCGTRAANWLYWRLGKKLRGWLNTENRLALLANENPHAIQSFVSLALDRNSDPTVLIGLARCPHSKAALTSLLQEKPLTTNRRLGARVQTNQQLAAALIGSAGLLLEPDSAKALAAEVLALESALSPSFFQIIDSLGRRPALPISDLYLRGVLDSGFRKAVLHRLVIVEDFRDPKAIAPLFIGARNVTLIVLNDTFGRADVTGFIGQSGVENIVVEHVRSRITRFSEAYVANHEASRATAEQITEALQTHPDLVAPDQRPYLEVAVADFLHFQSLKVAAVETLCADGAFDHIVIASDNQREESEFFRLLSGVTALSTDPRVEMVSIARTLAPRAVFSACVAAIKKRPEQDISNPIWAKATQRALFDLDQRAAKFATQLPIFSEPGSANRRHTLMFSNNNAAYNASTAHYANALSKLGPVTIMHVGLRANALQDEISALENSANPIQINPLHSQATSGAEATVCWLAAVILDRLTQLPGNITNHIAQINAARIAREVIEPQLVVTRALETWFSTLEKTGTLPDLVVLAPYRLPIVASVTALARRHAVASLTLEAHGLNSNYSRYLKVTSDYYGVVSDYFRQQAAQGFSIPLDRVAVVGTPRLIAPKDHDPVQARQTARRALQQEHNITFTTSSKGIISFFCQPSDWNHVALIWRNILLAAKALDLEVLLKPHPEETPTRHAAYQALAKKLGMDAKVHLLKGPPTPVIEASDVVLTAYSAAALDAAVLQVPVICITDGDIAYPVDQHLIIDAPLVQSAGALQQHLAEIFADPGAAQAKCAAFLRREPQFLDGPDDRLRQFVKAILDLPIEDRLRPDETVQASVFLEGPHPIYPI